MENKYIFVESSSGTPFLSCTLDWEGATMDSVGSNPSWSMSEKQEKRSSGIFTQRRKMSKKIKKWICQLILTLMWKNLGTKFKMRENLLHSQALDVNMSNMGFKSRDVKIKQLFLSTLFFTPTYCYCPQTWSSSVTDDTFKSDWALGKN